LSNNKSGKKMYIYSCCQITKDGLLIKMVIMLLLTACFF
jgi:hypothetical protein